MARLDDDSLKYGRGYQKPFQAISESLGLIDKYAKILNAGKISFTIRLIPPTSEVKGKELIAGIDELTSILKDKDLINKIIKRAYDENIRKVLQKRLQGSDKRGGGLSLSRGGRGGGRTTSTEEADREKAGVTRKARDLKDELFKRSPDELGDKWREVYHLIASPGKVVAPGVVAGFTIEQLLKIKMESDRSEFTSVYMMVEFGTGRVADPGPRRYQSEGKTPFKISPALAAFGGDTSWWFPFHKSFMYADRFLKGQKKLSRSKKKSKKIKIKKRDRANFLFEFAQGAPGPRSIKPRHVIFDARGIVAELQVAYEKAYKAITKDLNELVQYKIPWWPDDGFKFIGNPKINLFSSGIPKLIG